MWLTVIGHCFTEDLMKEPCRIYVRSVTLWSWGWTFTLWRLVNIGNQYHRDITTPLLLHHTPQPILSGYTSGWSKSFLQRCSKAGEHRAVPQDGLTQMYWSCGLRECEQQINNCTVFRKKWVKIQRGCLNFTSSARLRRDLRFDFHSRNVIPSISLKCVPFWIWVLWNWIDVILPIWYFGRNPQGGWSYGWEQLTKAHFLTG